MITVWCQNDENLQIENGLACKFEFYQSMMSQMDWNTVVKIANKRQRHKMCANTKRQKRHCQNDGNEFNLCKCFYA